MMASDGKSRSAQDLCASGGVHEVVRVGPSMLDKLWCSDEEAVIAEGGVTDNPWSCSEGSSTDSSHSPPTRHDGRYQLFPVLHFHKY